MALPFVITRESNDPGIDNIVESAFSTLEKIGGVNIPRRYSGAGPWAEGDYGSAKWYVNQALDPDRGQAMTNKFWDLFEQEYWQQKNRHYELTILDTDLFMPETNFVYGETRLKVLNNGLKISDENNEGGPYVTGVILSTNRVRSRGKGWELPFFTILLHELGHFYGLPSGNSPNYITETDPRRKDDLLDPHHCDDSRCVMEQVNIIGRSDLEEKALFVADNNPSWFCAYDLLTLHSELQKFYK